MNEKEIAEVRRSLSLQKNALTKICGCYVNAAGEIISCFEQSLGLMSEEETEKYLAIFRKTLSGAPEKNLMDIPFSTTQVLEGEQHKLLTALRNSRLEDKEALNTFFATVSRSVVSEENYVILLTCNCYDVPFKPGADASGNDSEQIFTFLLCSICPVKMTKSALTYDATQKVFRDKNGENAICPPMLGFLFPAFDDRKANIYNALLYTRATDDDHADFTASLFDSHIHMTAAAQGSAFHQVLAESLAEDCRFQVAKSVHEQLCQRMEEHKASHDPEPLLINKYVVEECLENCGVSPEKLEAFTEHYNDHFGKGADLPPKNVIHTGKFELRTPEVTIKVTPGHSDLVETRIIDGIKYILIRADDGVEFNGLDVIIS